MQQESQCRAWFVLLRVLDVDWKVLECKIKCLQRQAGCKCCNPPTSIFPSPFQKFTPPLLSALSFASSLQVHQNEAVYNSSQKKKNFPFSTFTKHYLSKPITAQQKSDKCGPSKADILMLNLVVKRMEIG